MALGWLLAVLAVQAEAPMDLDSPFLKTALIQDAQGKLEERVILKAKLTGASLEMETESGSIALFPKGQVAAILPRLPAGKEEYGTGEVEKALTLLQNLPVSLRDRPEASAEVLEKWRALLPVAAEKDVQRAEREKQQKVERKRADEAEVSVWVAEWSDFRKSRTADEIQVLRARGQVLLQKVPGEQRTVEEGLAFLAQWQARPGASPLVELEKLASVNASMKPEDLLAWTGAGVWGASFFGLLIGLGFVSSGLTRFKEGAWLGGLVFLPMGLAVLGGLGMVWWPMEGTGKEVVPALSPGMERLGLAAKNSVQPSFFFPPISVQAGGEETAAGLLAFVSPAEEPTGFLKARFGSGTCWLGEGSWTYRQTFTVIGLPLPLCLTFSGQAPSLVEWRQPEVQKTWLGRVPIPSVFGEVFFQSVLASWGQAAEGVGLGRLKLEEGQTGTIRMALPASGKRPELVKEKALAIYRKGISAEDLAQAFVDGHGKEFAGKFVLLDGVVEKVSSGSEYSGSSKKGDCVTGEPSKIGPDRFDVLYLRGVDRYGPRGDPLFVRCVIRSPLVFVMDSYGDLFLGPSVNPLQEKPVLKKGYRLQFLNEGRVQNREIKNNEIEVYGIDVSSPAELISYDPLNTPSPK